MPSRYVQPADNSNAASALSIACSNFPVKTTKGNTLIVPISAANVATTIASVTDTQGNNYQPAGIKVQDTVNAQAYWLYFASNIAGGDNLITAQFNLARAFRAIAAFEYEGLALANALLAVGNTFQPTPGTAPDAVTGGPLVSASRPALLFSFGIGETSAPNAGAGFIARLRVWAAAFANTTLLEDWRVTDPGVNPAGTFTLPAATQSVVLSALFLEAPDTGGSGGDREPQRKRSIHVPQLIKGETEEQKRARRIAQGIEADPDVSARAEKLAADRAKAQAQVEKLKRQIERFEASAIQYRQKVLEAEAKAQVRAARNRAAAAAAKAQQLRAQLEHLQHQELEAEQLIEEFDIAVISSMLAES